MRRKLLLAGGAPALALGLALALTSGVAPARVAEPTRALTGASGHFLSDPYWDVYAPYEAYDVFGYDNYEHYYDDYFGSIYDLYDIYDNELYDHDVYGGINSGYYDDLYDDDDWYYDYYEPGHFDRMGYDDVGEPGLRDW